MDLPKSSGKSVAGHPLKLPQVQVFFALKAILPNLLAAAGARPPGAALAAGAVLEAVASAVALRIFSTAAAITATPMAAIMSAFLRTETVISADLQVSVQEEAIALQTSLEAAAAVSAATTAAAAAAAAATSKHMHFL